MKKIIYLNFILLLVLTSCDNRYLSDEEIELNIPDMQKARIYIEENKWTEAEISLKEVIKVNPHFARPHLDLAMIYQNHKTNYIHAIYHYDKYMELKPMGENFFILEQQSNLFKRLSVSLNPLITKKTNQSDSIILQEENIPISSQKNIYYIVKAGDTLSKISKRFYNNATSYDIIYKANNDMKNPSDIKPGQTIIIPLLD